MNLPETWDWDDVTWDDDGVPFTPEGREATVARRTERLYRLRMFEPELPSTVAEAIAALIS